MPTVVHQWSFTIVVVVTWLLLSPPARAQTDSVRPGVNKPFEKPEVAGFIEAFEKEGREVYDQREAIIQRSGVRSGIVVADIGAGTGLFTRLFSPLVGPDGSVIAVDIAEAFTQHVERTSRAAGLANVRGVVCTSTSVNLPPQSIDLAFICDTYHHFEFPHKTMRSIYRALRPGGKVVLVEFDRVPGHSREWVLNHLRAGRDVFVREIEESGFKLVGDEQGLFKESYLVRFEKVEDHRIGSAMVDEQGVRLHAVESDFQSGPTKIRVLTPREMPAGKRFPVLYVLPVEAGDERRYGDGLVEAQRLGLADQYGVICVAPTFSQLPWYADHSTNLKLRQERHLLDVVVPAVESLYPTMEQPAGRLLIGFSKSGWGAFSLLLRHPDVFGRAAAWDSPLSMDWPSKYGSQEIFGTAENFAAYQIVSLFERRAPLLKESSRLVLAGHGNFRAETKAAHRKLDELSIPHKYLDGPDRKHDWHSGWLAEICVPLFAK